ncbi:MAG: hypothetical protein FRX48_01267 [Lasallia pustulata]|uniref:TLC domain-containing protein n=1 Tax=Lasallia pustulata TaxID=136370 RepID=A0A5M8Q008_9LECA|nr:MAG: hypothetical protein FRX48_01267 [Lasallia pustulata]
MLDPFLPPPALLTTLSRPIASSLSLTTLPLHIHEVLLAFLFYHVINTYFSPYISTKLFPSYYPALNARTKRNWDVHVVSLVQSCSINVLALWVIMGFAAGYFLWDLCVCVAHVDVFGWGLLAHAVAALVVFSLGFRPFVNYYGPTFILYELSSPFLNFHWFFDKINMTGSRAQLYNGIVLLATFFACRLVWGTYQSVRVYQDVWAAIQTPGILTTTDTVTNPAIRQSVDPTKEIMRFEGDRIIPIWLACTYLGSNIVLNTLNFYWFGKMIETVKKRFQPGKKGKRGLNVDGKVREEERAKVKVDMNGGQVLMAEKTEVRRRKG